MSLVSSRLRAFGPTIFAEMTRLANEHQAVNLSQGFPDFDGPELAKEAVIRAIRDGKNQYARSMGALELVEAIADERRRLFGLAYDPLREVIVTSGATECIASAILGLVNPGDEVVLLEPFYDSYPVAVALAGGVSRYVTLRYPDFELDLDRLDAALTDRTRLLVLNTPHNPSGKVFTPAELEAVAERCLARGVRVLADEVYEHLTYDGARHVPIASLDGMRARTLSISSAGKSYSFTGWKVGWATGPADMVQAVQAAHQYVTFSTATPIQVGLAEAMRRLGDPYFAELRRDYTARRDFLLGALSAAGLPAAVPKGAYFVLADIAGSGLDDVTFARRLVERGKVAAIPPSAFYAADRAEGAHLLRFTFSKRLETLAEGARRLGALDRSALAS